MTETRQGHEGRAHEKFFIGFLAELDNSKSFGKISFFGLFWPLWPFWPYMKAKKIFSVK